MKPAYKIGKSFVLWFLGSIIVTLAGLQQAISCASIIKVDTRYLSNAQIVFKGTVITQKRGRGTSIHILKVQEAYKGKTQPFEIIIDSPELLEEGETYIIGADREEILQKTPRQEKPQQSAPLSILTWSPLSCSSGSTVFKGTPEIMDRVRFDFRKELNISKKETATLIKRITGSMVRSLEQEMINCVSNDFHCHKKYDEREYARNRARDDFSYYRVVEAIEPLLQLIKKKSNPEVRILAIESLGRMKTTKAVPGLIAVLKDKNMKIKSSAAEALGRIKARQAVPHLITALSSEDQDVGSSAAWALFRIADPITEQALIQVFRDKKNNNDTRKWIALALGEIKSQKAVSYLIEAFQEEKEHAGIRDNIASSLGKIKDPVAVPLLIDVLQDKNRNLRDSAARALGEFEDPRAIAPLVNALFREEELSVHRSYPDARAEALCKIKQQKKVAAVLLEQFKTGKGHYRANAIWILECIGDTEHKTLIVEALKDKDGMVRRTSAKVLVETGDPAVLPLVAKLLNDVGYGVGSAVAKVLCKSKHKKKISEILLEKYKTEKKPIDTNTAYLFGCIKDPKSVALLIETLKSKNRGTRESAAWALGEIGDLDAVPHLINLLNDKSDDVQRATAYALQNFNNIKAKLALKAFYER